MPFVALSLVLPVLLLGGTGASDFRVVRPAPVALPYVLPPGYEFTPLLSEAPVFDPGPARPVLRSGRDYALVVETGAGRLVLDLDERGARNGANALAWLALHRALDGRRLAEVRARPGLGRPLEGPSSPPPADTRVSRAYLVERPAAP